MSTEKKETSDGIGSILSDELAGAGLQTKIKDLGEALSNMKLVLDTGALVGGTSAKIDNELGTLAMRRGRGN